MRISFIMVLFTFKSCGWHDAGYEGKRTGGKVFFLDYRNLFSEIGDDANGKWLSLVPTQLFRLVRNEVSLNNLRRFKRNFFGRGSFK